jgi:hypothetical protein
MVLEASASQYRFVEKVQLRLLEDKYGSEYPAEITFLSSDVIMFLGNNLFLGNNFNWTERDKPEKYCG